MSRLILSLALAWLTTASVCEPTVRAGEPWYKKTAGGTQFWGDVHHLQGWRIQQNVITGHHRLLDPDNYRHCHGEYGKCLAELKQIQRQREIPEMTGRVVILVHGIVRSSNSFHKMAPVLEQAGFDVVPFEYPSTRRRITVHADYLNRVIASMPHAREIHFVCHSMGGLVLRGALLKQPIDPRLSRAVMCGTPNHGAAIADLIRCWPAFKLIYGPAGQELVTDTDEVIAHLPTPTFQFGILAGSRGTEEGYNPIVPGDDDGVVSVESTKLSGASDFLRVRGLHTPLLSNEAVIAATTRYLTTGRFREAKIRTPIP